MVEPLTARSVLRQLRSEVPEVDALAVVDLHTGKFTHLEYQGNHPEELLGFLAHLVRELFVGDNIRTIRSVLGERSPRPADSRQMEEITFRSSHQLHVFTRIPVAPDYVMVAVSPRTTRLGVLIAALKRACDSFAQVSGHPWAEAATEPARSA